jgi:predicted RNase H-like HicB family nuclease
MKKYTAYIHWDAEARTYTGFFPGIFGAEASGRDMNELKLNLQEALDRQLKEPKPRPRKTPERPPPGYSSLDILI